MVLLILFGFIAGAATAVSPCVLPVLPIALSAGATGGRRRPLGIVAGRAAGRRGVTRGGDGFWSGTAVGASLGIVYAPCAGPILAGVITVSASQNFTAGRLAVAHAYEIGRAPDCTIAT